MNIETKGLKSTEKNSVKFKRIENLIKKEGFEYEVIYVNDKIMSIQFFTTK